MDWWAACPNCGHPMMLHDIDTPEDPKPECCIDGCECHWTDYALAADWVQADA